MPPTPGQQPNLPPQQPLAPNPYAQLAQQQPVSTYRPKNHMPALIISLSIVLLLLFGSAGFGLWAFTSREDYKNNSDKKVAAAVEVAKVEEGKVKDAELAEKEKSPTRTYKGPASYGSLNIQYPKTWSAFVTEQANGGMPVDAYFHPSYVPGINSGTAFALRVQVLAQPYAQIAKQHDPANRKGAVVTPYSAPKVPGVVGIRVEGQISESTKVSGTMIVLPLRDKTIQISTQSPSFRGDLDKYILANLTFEP
jgi:hypothetical protein